MAARKKPRWTPSHDDYARIFSEQNPWKSGGSMPSELAPASERPLAQMLWKRVALNEPPRYQVVIGPRRVGKTTTMYQTVRHLLESGVPTSQLWWFRLDHPLLMRTPMSAFVDIVLNEQDGRDGPAYLFFDELTYAENWDRWLKDFFDRKLPIRVVASSSSSPELRAKRHESGIGRWEEQHLSPYSFGEFLHLIGRSRELPAGASLGEVLRASIQSRVRSEDLAEPRRRYVLTGGFPELLLSADQPLEESAVLRSQRVLRGDAIERAIYKDIPQAVPIESPATLERLIYILAAQTCGVLSPQGVCKSLGASTPTFERYLRHLENAFLVFTLPNYAGSEEARQRRGKKLYFADGAVRNAALQRGLAPLRDPSEMGVLLENAAAAHLHGLAQQAGVRLYHWRDEPFEVDLVYDDPRSPLALEITTSGNHSTKGLLEFGRRFPAFARGLYLVSAESGLFDLVPPTPERPGRIPLDLLLIASSALSESSLASRLGAFPRTTKAPSNATISTPPRP